MFGKCGTNKHEMSVASCETPHEGISSLNEDPALQLHVLLPNWRMVLKHRISTQGVLAMLNKAQADFPMAVHSSPL